METTTKITGNWNDLKTKLKEKFSTLTDADLVYSAGKEDELVAGIAKKLGKTQVEINDIINDLQAKNKEAVTSETEIRQKDSKQTVSQRETSKQY